MAGLIRTRVSSFKIEEGFTLSEIEAMRDADTLLEHIIPVDKVFMHLPAFTVKKEGEKLLYNGNPIALSFCENIQAEENDSEKVPVKEQADKKDTASRINKAEDEDNERFRVYDSQHNFIGIYQLQKENLLKPYKLFL